MNKFIRRIRDHFLRDILNHLYDLDAAVHVLTTDPAYDHEAQLGFNQIESRRTMFEELIKLVDFDRFVETGTFLGHSTGYLAQTTGKPIFSVEYNYRLFRLAKMRLKKIQNISMHNMDSRAFLKEMIQNPEITNSRTFFYLDAHWGKDVPLKEEIEMIFENFEKFFILIDDFEVATDPNYIHDGYGTLKNIDFESLKNKFPLQAYYPSASAKEGDRMVTGYLALTDDHKDFKVLENFTHLKRFS